MRALIYEDPVTNAVSVELIAESDEDVKQLERIWDLEQSEFAVTCEQWRDKSAAEEAH